MKYTNEITISLPRKKVIELFDDPENLKKWQKGLMSFEHVSGEAGKPGAVSKLKYNTVGRKIEMTETVLTRNLPYEFSGVYEAPGMWNKHENFFEEAGATLTRWKTVSEFRASSFSLKLMLRLFPAMFRKQTLKMMNDFRNFAEDHAD